MTTAWEEHLADLAARSAEAERLASEKAASEKAAQEKAAVEKSAAEKKLLAHVRLFMDVQAGIRLLEAQLDVTPREAWVGPLGEFVAIMSSAASEGLQFIAAAARQLD
jgi:hypothetical protein